MSETETDDDELKRICLRGPPDVIDELEAEFPVAELTLAVDTDEVTVDDVTEYIDQHDLPIEYWKLTSDEN